MDKIAIIGGGAAGMACAVMLARKGAAVTLLERGERLGRKLSATGNGQGNVTNTHMDARHYFSDEQDKVARALACFSWEDAVGFLQSMGGIFLPDARGRVYPAGRQASAVTDLFRRELSRLGVEVVFQARVQKLAYDRSFSLEWEGGAMRARSVVLAAGGCAAKNFGTDGSAYALAEAFGHTIVPPVPSLVQIRCAPGEVRGLKGIRTDARLLVLRGGREVYSVRGDVLFSESGLSGDAAFYASAYAKKGDTILLDLLPDVPQERLLQAAERGGLLCIVNNGLARALERRAGSAAGAAGLVKAFPLTAAGTLGFDYAQVTKGGVPLGETDEGLMSRMRAGLYFAGEILNVDGECGGYNLQWAFTSAHCVAEALQ